MANCIEGMTNKELISRLRRNLTAQGTEKVVRLHMGDAGYFPEELVRAAIQSLRTKITLKIPMSTLEVLGVEVLLASAHLRRD